jgi:pectin methylesterase-like acyl-CoA thioesterase
MRAIRTFGLRRLIVLGCVVGLAATFCGTATATNYLLDPSFSGTDGSAGEGYTAVYKTINSALAGMPAGTSPTTPNVLYIEPGTYNTAATTGVSLSDSRSNIALIGLSNNADDVVITSTLDSAYNPGTGALGTTGSATLQLKGNNVSAENITFANSTDTPYIISSTGNHMAVTPAGVYPTSGGISQTATQPAVALLLQGDEQAFKNVKVLGYQDTLYMKGGRVYFNNSYVSGDDDFMFANGTVVFKNSTLNIDGDHSGGAMTAASTDKRTSNGFVFMNNTITGNSVHGNTVIDPMNAANMSGPASQSMYLGRPWGWQQSGGDASTVFINNQFQTNAIKPAGWTPWNSDETNNTDGIGNNNNNPAEDSRFAEYNNVDGSNNPVVTSSRVSWSHQLTAGQAAAYTVANIFSRESNYPWYGQGYPSGDASNPGTGSADPNAANYSWPAFWGDRNTANDTTGSSADLIANNPASYSDPSWTLTDVSWDPDAQLSLVPEPGSAVLLGLGGFICWRIRRNRKQRAAQG